jgi:hypothetical protein
MCNMKKRNLLLLLATVAAGLTFGLVKFVEWSWDAQYAKCEDVQCELNFDIMPASNGTKICDPSIEVPPGSPPCSLVLNGPCYASVNGTWTPCVAIGPKLWQMTWFSPTYPDIRSTVSCPSVQCQEHFLELLGQQCSLHPSRAGSCQWNDASRGAVLWQIILMLVWGLVCVGLITVFFLELCESDKSDDRLP